MFQGNVNPLSAAMAGSLFKGQEKTTESDDAKKKRSDLARELASLKKAEKAKKTDGPNKGYMA